jgi:DNA-binding GntR family transcriptional regulator
MFYIVIDKRSKTAYYQQIIKSISKAIDMGMLKDRDQLPTLEAISSFFDISEIAVRRAFDVLELEGKIKRIQGKGTFIKARPHLKIPMNEFYEINYYFIEMADKVHRQVNFIDYKDHKTILKLITKLNQYPIYYQYAEINLKIEKDIQDVLDSNDSIYTVFFKLSGFKRFHFDSLFHPKNADTMEAVLLEVDFGAPLFHIITTIYGDNQEVIATVHTYFPSEFVSFEVQI